MNMDQPVTRTFSCHLRFLQLALQTIVALLIAKMGDTGCSTMIITVGQIVFAALLILNFLSIVLIKCTNKVVSRRVFWVIYAINLVLAGVLLFAGLLGIGQANSCANNRVLHRFVGFQAMIAIIVTLITLFSKYDFAMRYTNGPGNLTWVFLFFSFPWSGAFQKFYILAGVLNLLITISMLSVHLVFLMTKFNPNIKKIINYVWLGSLAAMIIAELVVFIAYVSGAGSSQTSNDHVAIKIAQTFIPINIIDGLFWIFGYISLYIRSQEELYEQALGIQERKQRQIIF